MLENITGALLSAWGIISIGIIIDLAMVIILLCACEKLTAGIFALAFGGVLVLTLRVLILLAIMNDGFKDPWASVLGLYAILNTMACGLSIAWWNHRNPEKVLQRERELA